jgi:ribosomal protein S1
MSDEHASSVSERQDDKEGAFKYLVKRVTTLEQEVSAKHQELVVNKVRLNNARNEVHLSRRAVTDLKMIKLKNKRLKKKLDQLDHER